MNEIYIFKNGEATPARIEKLFETHGPYTIEGKRLDFLTKVQLLVDSSTTSTIQSGTSTSSAKTGSMVGRAVVGGVLTGGAGAIIGGLSGRRDSVINTVSSETLSTELTAELIFEDGSSLYIFLKNMKAFHWLLGFANQPSLTDEELKIEKQKAKEYKKEEKKRYILAEEQKKSAIEKERLRKNHESRKDLLWIVVIIVFFVVVFSSGEDEQQTETVQKRKDKQQTETAQKRKQDCIDKMMSNTKDSHGPDGYEVRKRIYEECETLREGGQEKLSPVASAPIPAPSKVVINNSKVSSAIKSYIDNNFGVPELEASWYKNIKDVTVLGDKVLIKTNLASYSEQISKICSGVSGFVFSNENSALGLHTIEIFSNKDTLLIKRNGIGEICYIP